MLGKKGFVVRNSKNQNVKNSDNSGKFQLGT